jgi:hypothetical protein
VNQEQEAGIQTGMVPFEAFMKRVMFCVWVVLLASMTAWAMPLGTSTRSVIPADVQQIISVDYRALRNSETAMALKQRVLPDTLKQFETALRGVGVDPDKDVEQLTFVSFRIPKQGARIVGVAQGQFTTQAFLKKMRLQKVRPAKYRNSDLYPMSGMQMTFLDDYTLLFGDTQALRFALDARDGFTATLDSNAQVADLISSVDSGTVWSVLDQQGTQNMLRSALGDASGLADYDMVKKRLVGSRYTMNFNSGVNFDLDVVTSDSITAATLSSLLQAGMLYRKVNATASEKVALDSVSVDSDSTNLRLRFRTDDKKFQSLLSSELFASVSR